MTPDEIRHRGTDNLCLRAEPSRSDVGLERAKCIAAPVLLHPSREKIHGVMYAPIWELGFINGVGARVEESGLGLIAGHAYSSPYEDLKLKGK